MSEQLEGVKEWEIGGDYDQGQSEAQDTIRRGKKRNPGRWTVALSHPNPDAVKPGQNDQGRQDVWSKPDAEPRVCRQVVPFQRYRA